jgi:hypothetical protein
MKTKTKIMITLIAITGILFTSVLTAEAKRPEAWKGVGRSESTLFIYVTSQDLFYDSIVTADPLPYNESNAHTFQLLKPSLNTAAPLQTEFGPGDTEYNGGKWWVDIDGNGEMDPGDHYFSCPLLGPGYELD